MAWLQVEGPAGPHRAEVTRHTMVVGRTPRCDLVIDDASVSRVHARIRRHGADCVIEDLNSRNGTFVNGRRIREPTRLADGDRIVLGQNVAAVFHAVPEAAGDAAAADDESLERTSIVPPSLVGTIEVHPEAKLRAVVEIARTLCGTLRLEDLLAELLDALLRIFPQADRSFVLLRDRATGRLVSTAARARDGTSSEAQVSATIVERVLRTGQGVVSVDAGEDTRFDASRSISRLHIRSVLCAPLVGRSGVAAGVIQLHSERGGTSFTGEDLDVLAAVAGMAALAVENVRMHEDLRARERLARELDLAREVQLGFLPPHPPRIPGYSFDATYLPAASVGGDYYGFVPLPDGRLVVAVGDVSGKGMPAALLMARLSSDVRSAALATSDPVEAVESVGCSLAEAAGDDRFVTLLYMVLDPSEHTLVVVNAGHLPPLLRRRDGRIEEFGEDAAGLPLNVLPGRAGLRPAVTRLEPGSVVLAVTDGITEATDRQGNVFGLDRLRALLVRSGDAPEATSRRVVDAVRTFTGSEGLADDVTLVVFGSSGGDAPC
jgi:sigma-B regulation protein RsbU (phosphoserine phosphatase)